MEGVIADVLSINSKATIIIKSTVPVGYTENAKKIFAQVIAFDINQAKVDLINSKRSPIADKEIEEFLATKDLNIIATTDAYMAFAESQYVIILFCANKIAFDNPT